jgi:hypothetical protein
MEYYIIECGYTNRLLNNSEPTDDFIDFLGGSNLIFVIEQIESNTQVTYKDKCINPNDLQELIDIVKNEGYFGRGVFCFSSDNFDKFMLLDKLKYTTFCKIESIIYTKYFTLRSEIKVNYVKIDTDSK